MTPPATPKRARGESTGRQRFPLHALMVCCLIMGLIDVILLSNAWLFSNPTKLALVGFAMSQCSLIGAWAATSSSHLAFRFMLPVLTIGLSWWVACHLLSVSLSSQFVVLWIAILVVVTFVVFISVRAGRYWSTTESSSEFWTVFLQTDVRTMMAWTFLFGISFGFLQFAHHHWDWTISAIDSGELAIVPMLGLAIGGQAVLCLWLFRAHGYFDGCIRGVITVILIVTICYACELIGNQTTLNDVLFTEVLILSMSSNLVTLFVLLLYSRVAVNKRCLPDVRGNTGA